MNGQLKDEKMRENANIPRKHSKYNMDYQCQSSSSDKRHKKKWVRSLTSLYPAYVAASGSGVTILVRDRQERIDIEYVGRLDDAGGESEPGVTNTNVTASERTKRWQLEL